MGLLDALISSLPSAPGTGFGPTVAAGGSAAAGGGGAPPGCGMGGGPGLDGPGTTGPGTDGPGEPDHTPGPEPYTPAHPPLSWDHVTGGATEGSSGGSAPASSGSSGDRFFHPREGGRSYASVRALDRYGRWLREGSPGTRAAKALTGLVVIPIGAIATCAENAIRSPLPG